MSDFMTGHEKIELMKRLGCPNVGEVVRRNEMVLCEEITRLMLLMKELLNTQTYMNTCVFEGDCLYKRE